MEVNNTGAQIEIQNNIEKNFGDLSIGATARIASDKTGEICGRIEEIRGELMALKEVDPAFEGALGYMDKALAAFEDEKPEPASGVSTMKKAAETLGQAEKATSSAINLAKMIGAAAVWIGTLVL